MGLCVVEGSGYATGYSDGYADGQTDLLDTFEVGNDVTVSHEEACPSNNWSDYGYEDQASGHWIRSTCNICGKIQYANSYTPNHSAHSRTISETGTFQYRRLVTE